MEKADFVLPDESQKKMEKEKLNSIKEQDIPSFEQVGFIISLILLFSSKPIKLFFMSLIKSNSLKTSIPFKFFFSK